MSQIVEDFYNSQAQREWERFDRHPTEFAVTQKALARYLPPPPARILDCGGGPGRYAIHLAGCGYAVTLLDLAQANLDLAAQKAAEAGVGLHGLHHGNALDLTHFAAKPFDALLLMGPLYHLVRLEDRQQALRQAYQALKPGGMIFAAFITLYAPLRYDARNLPMELVENPRMTEQILSSGVNEPAFGFTEAYFAKPEEIIPLVESAGFKTHLLLGQEGIVAGMEEGVNALSGAAWAYWAELNYRLGQHPALLGASDHILYIGQK